MALVHKKKSGASNELRIIGGLCRRRVVRFPDGEGLRPTPDRVRETLFNWLGQTLEGQHCLDLFAGSGALGFEAASRGAESVLMADVSPVAVAALQANAEILGLSRVEIVRCDALAMLESPTLKTPSARMKVPERGFDVLFLDPPYRRGFLERLGPLIQRWAAPEAVVYVEAEVGLEHFPNAPAWKTVKSGRAGQVFYHLMRCD